MNTRWTMLWAACYGLTVAAAVGGLFIVHAALAVDERIIFVRMLSANAVVLIITAVFLLAFTGLLAHWLTRMWFTPLRRYAGLIHLIATSNPALRIEPEGGAEIRELARAINQFATLHQTALQEVEARVSEVNASLAREKSHLAALMSELAQSVVVCNADGCILLYNEQARRLFAAAPAFFGLGRSLYALLDQDIVAREYAHLRNQLAQGETRPTAEFSVPFHDGRMVRVRMAPVSHDASSADTRPEGYVLLFNETGMPAPSTAPEAAETPLPGRPVYYDFDLFHQPGQTREIDDRPLRGLAYTAFDTETTGLEPSAGDEIIAIGAVRIINCRLLHSETYLQLVDPRRALQPESARVHGITPSMLAGKPLIDQVLPAFHRFCEGTVLVGHNAAFDMRFLQLKELSSGVSFIAPVLDTLLLSAVLHGDTLGHRLDDIAARLGVEATDRHTALGDAVTTARVFLKLIPLLEARGISTLREAREASARTVHARIRY
jgi:DNA polymerase-3 subunit epsilon